MAWSRMRLDQLFGGCRLYPSDPKRLRFALHGRVSVTAMGMNTPGRTFPRFDDEPAVLAIIDGFRAHTLVLERWTHQAHLAVGLWHVQRFGEEESKRLLRHGISTYNESVGVPNSNTRGYHETV